jgi:hypothetical protein
MVKELRPWKGGHPDLWTLHALDVTDKHHGFIRLGANLFGLQLNFEFFAENGVESADDQLFSIGLAGKDRPELVPGLEISRRAADSDTGTIATEWMRLTHRPLAEVVFGTQTELPGWEVTSALTQLINSTETSIQALLDHCES